MRRPGYPPRRPIPVLVVGFDGFPESEHALGAAADLAARLHAFVHVVHAVSLDDYPVDPDADDWEEQLAGVLEDHRRTVGSLLAGVARGWTYQAERGNAVELVAGAAEAHDALMIVLGTRRGGLGQPIDRLLHPSIPAQVIRRQHRPVLVVPLPPRQRAGSHRPAAR
jgi:nucleotide-binding universal stress UspA family protein